MFITTVCMLFMIKQQRPPADFYVTLLGKEVTFASSARDLGLKVDSTLSSLLNISQTLFHHV